jgi:glycosyltransferase involved in cell wall biosynthesis
MKLALVVPRYGDGLFGGAAQQARWIAQRLAVRHDVAILTTSAGEAGDDEARSSTRDAVTVRRFPVTRGSGAGGDDGERGSLEDRGPVAPGLVDHVRAQASAYDAFLFFSYSAWTTCHGLPAVPQKSIVVPTAEDESAPRGRFLQQFLRLPAAYAFNSPEEKADLAHRAGSHDLRGEVIGFGIDDTPALAAHEIRQRLDLLGDFIVYAGRLGRAQGCSRLFEDFTRYVRERSPHVSLVLLGKPASPIPVHVNITHLGLLGEVERRSVIGASRLLVEPSAEGSLALPLLEAWTLGRPALVNGQSPALLGQVTRANGGLAYTSYEEMAETLTWLLERPREADALGQSGREYTTAHYAAPVIVDKYERLLATVRGH